MYTYIKMRPAKLPTPKPANLLHIYAGDQLFYKKFQLSKRSAELLFLFFADFQVRMVAVGRKGPARWALKQKSKYYKLMKEG